MRPSGSRVRYRVGIFHSTVRGSWSTSSRGPLPPPDTEGPAAYIEAYADDQPAVDVTEIGCHPDHRARGPGQRRGPPPSCNLYHAHRYRTPSESLTPSLSFSLRRRSRPASGHSHLLNGQAILLSQGPHRQRPQHVAAALTVTSTVLASDIIPTGSQAAPVIG